MIVAITNKNPQALNRPDSARSWGRSGLALAWVGINVSEQQTDDQVTTVLLTWGEALWTPPVIKCDQPRESWHSKTLLFLSVKAGSWTAFKLELGASEQEEDCGEKAYRNDHTWGPTDLGGRWDLPPWTLTYLSLQSPEAADDLLSLCALSHLCWPQVLEGRWKGEHTLREKR